MHVTRLIHLIGAGAVAAVVALAGSTAAQAVSGPDFRANGVYIRSCASTSCSANGQGNPGDGASLNCWTTGRDGAQWINLQDKRTHVQGWSRGDLIKNIPDGWDNHC